MEQMEIHEFGPAQYLNAMRPPPPFFFLPLQWPSSTNKRFKCPSSPSRAPAWSSSVRLLSAPSRLALPKLTERFYADVRASLRIAREERNQLREATLEAIDKDRRLEKVGGK